MNKLLAQRLQFINSFFAVKQNTIDIRTRLIACARQLAKQQHPFFSCENSTEAVNALRKDESLTDSQYLIMLQLYNAVHQQPLLMHQSLYQSKHESLQKTAPLFAMLVDIEDDPLMLITDYKLLSNQLLVCFYRQKQLEIAHFSSAYFNKTSAIIQLYLTVLDRNNPLNYKLISTFIALHAFESSVFELYIVGLNETDIKTVINKLVSNEYDIDDQKSSNLLIQIIELSGSSQFIPLLAEYLQKTEYTIRAHHALRILLGDLLDTLMPYPIQFNSDIEQQQLDFPYYGAKILHFWETKLKPSLPERILSGKAITVKNLVMLAQQGSQAHRRVANLHHIHLSTSMQVPYYATPEMVL